MEYIPYGRQQIDDSDIQAVIKVLQSNELTQGPVVDLFEKSVAEYCQAKHATAVCNATAALHLACKALGVGPGDIVWTTPNTFVSSANCARFCGASVDFVDICPDTYNLSVSALADKLVLAKQQNKLPKVLIPVHFAGQSCDMQAIKALSTQYGFQIIEDASHAIGATYQGIPIGACTYSDITVFSFHPVKIITSGEGGMCLTNNQKLADKIRQYRTHGITRDEQHMTHSKEGDWYYQQLDLGFNYRITDIQCALGLSQMKKLDDFISQRNRLAERYHQALEAMPYKQPILRSDCYSAYHLYVIQTLPECNKTRKQIFDYLRTQSIGVNVHYIPVHLQPYYQQFGFKTGDFPVAETYYQNAITLPLYASMTTVQQDTVIAELNKALYD